MPLQFALFAGWTVFAQPQRKLGYKCSNYQTYKIALPALLFNQVYTFPVHCRIRRSNMKHVTVNVNIKFYEYIILHLRAHGISLVPAKCMVSRRASPSWQVIRTSIDFSKRHSPNQG
jgi:hypothetical protein